VGAVGAAEAVAGLCAGDHAQRSADGDLALAQRHRRVVDGGVGQRLVGDLGRGAQAVGDAGDEARAEVLLHPDLESVGLQHEEVGLGVGVDVGQGD